MKERHSHSVRGEVTELGGQRLRFRFRCMYRYSREFVHRELKRGRDSGRYLKEEVEEEEV